MPLSLSPSLSDAALQACNALDARQSPLPPAARGPQRCQMEGEVEERPTRRQERGLETWQKSDHCGFLCFAVDARSMRWDTCSANDRAGRFAGLHREEYLARMASYDMQPYTSDLRLLCSNVACIVLVARHICVQLKAAADRRPWFVDARCLWRLFTAAVKAVPFYALHQALRAGKGRWWAHCALLLDCASRQSWAGLQVYAHAGGGEHRGVRPRAATHPRSL